MPLFIEYFESIKAELSIKKQAEILRSIKKKIENSEEEMLAKIRDDEDSGYITDLVIADDGSVRTYLKDRKEPIRAYADTFTVSTTTIYKHFVPLIIRNLLKIGWFGKGITILALYLNKNIVAEWLGRIFAITPILLKDEHWSQPVKEIRRVLKEKFDINIVDAVCLAVEYDSAYKNRLQDILPLLDKSKLTGYFSTLKELSRLLDILSERDYDFMSEKWKQIKKFIKLLLLIPSIRKKLVSILKEINLDEIRFSKEDIYWINQFGTYRYQGLSLEERHNNNIKIYGGIR